MSFNRVSQRKFRVNTVMISPARTVAFQILGRFQIGNNPLHRPLRDSHTQRHIAELRVCIAGNQQQHVRMIAQKCPVRQSGTVL